MPKHGADTQKTAASPTSPALWLQVANFAPSSQTPLSPQTPSSSLALVSPTART